jgi:hypothetical protein
VPSCVALEFCLTIEWSLLACSLFLVPYSGAAT